jgi:hypothetical protein
MMDASVPAETAAFLAETRAYTPPLRDGNELIDAYAVRLKLLMLLYAVRSWAEREVDFRRLMQLALTANDKGWALRHAATGAELKDLVCS